MTRLIQRIGILCALALLGSCASTRDGSRGRLPFHVAVIPLSPASVSVLPPEANEDEDVVPLELDSEAMSRSVVATLGERRFTKVTLLAPPAGAPGFAELPTREQDTHWIRESERLEADLLLECDLSFQAGVRSAINEKFWLNLPLFFLGGPVSYFVNDRDYSGSARLRARIHDLNPILGERASLEDGRSQVTRVESRFERTTLDFLDRTGATAGRIALSLFVPAGLVSSRDEAVRERVSEAIVAGLADGLEEELRDSADELLAADGIAGFQLDPAVALRSSADEVHLAGDVLVRTSAASRMDSFRLSCGGYEASGDFGPGAVDEELSSLRERYLRFPFEARVPRDPASGSVRLELYGGGRELIIRTYTFPLRGGAGGPLSPTDRIAGL